MYEPAPENAQGWCAPSDGSIARISALCRLSNRRTAGFARPGRWRDLALFWPLVVYGLLPLMRGVQASPATLVSIVAMSLFVAFWKDVFFRGIILRILRERGDLRAATLSASCIG
jgi:membrane protease YdiL (CAAX protease family)